ncbi:DNA-binding protein [Microbacterium trichothecenolyticum]|nr:DNA-binding protein [Microbacterium trichothecenolyticum]
MAETTSPRDRFAPVEGVAGDLGLGVDEIMALVHEGLIRGIEIGSPPRWHIDLDSVDVYLDDQSEAARRAALWRQSQAASFPELWGRGEIRNGD